MRVFLAATSLNSEYGGPAYSVSSLALALARGGAEVGLWAADQSGMTSKLLTQAPGLRCLSGTMRHAYAEFGKPDVIHDNGLWLPHNHRLAGLASSSGVPRIVSTRGMLSPWAIGHKRTKKWFAWRLYQRRDLMSAQVHHATSAAEAVHLGELSLGVQVRVIVNGVDIPAAGTHGRADHPGQPPAALRTALFVGRIYPVKGLPMLIEAWARERPRDWRLVIAGPDEAGHRREVERTIVAAGLDEVVSFSGELAGEAKTAAFGGADLFVLPTHSESFGMSVAEALAHGLPVLTTTAAPWPALESEGCGWRVDPTVPALAAGLRQATSQSSEALRAMGAKGATMVASGYTWAGVAKKFIALYSEIS